MIVYVAFEFPYIKAKTKKAQSLIAEINSECDTMSVAFDASGSWVSSVIDGDDEEDDDDKTS